VYMAFLDEFKNGFAKYISFLVFQAKFPSLGLQLAFQDFLFVSPIVHYLEPFR